MDKRAKKSVLVIGGGASGLAAAIEAASKGGNVTLLERKERIGKKLLSTGNGRCNFSNEDIQGSCYRSSSPQFIEQVLKENEKDLVMTLMNRIGVVPRKINGYYYPASNQAASVVECLAREADLAGVSVFCEAFVQAVLPTAAASGSTAFDILAVVKGEQKSFRADRVILAAGSKAAAHTGSDGNGYQLAAALGHSLIPMVPALVQLRADKGYPKALAGIRCEAEVSLFIEGEPAIRDKGELQLTDYGLSGIVVFQLSRYASYALLENKKVKAVIDFAADIASDKLFQMLKERCSLLGQRKAVDLFVGMLPKKLGETLVRCSGLEIEKPCKRLEDREIGKLADQLKGFEVMIIGTNGFDRAQVCAGGIDLKQISNRMESKLVKGLYICGEVMDVDGICGGYNLHWAFLTGLIAGRAVLGVENA